MRAARLLIAVFVFGAAGCPATPDPAPPPRKPKGPQVRAFTEASPVTALAAAGGQLFVGTTRGIDRWDLRTGERVFIGPPAGLQGEHVRQLAAAPKADQIWIVTDAGVALYDVATESVAQVPPPLPHHASAMTGLAAIAPDPAGGAWVGSKSGLYHVDLDGVWRPAGFTAPVTALYVARDGALWLGTTGGVAVRRADGSYDRFDDATGLAVGTVRQMLEGPDGGIMVIGEDPKGQARLGIETDGDFTTFRPSPDVRIAGGARLGNDVVLATSRELFLVTTSGGARKLTRDGLHLVAVAGKRRRNPYTIDRVNVTLAAEATAVLAVGGEVMLGTTALGTARVDIGRDAPQRKRAVSVKWLRRRELVSGATTLTVACVKASECYLATGSDRTWRYDGTTFAEVPVTTEGAAITLATVRSPEGDVLAIYRSAGERALHVARLDRGRFVEMAQVAVETPGGVTGLSFAKLSPDGLLWLGLQYLDEENEARPYGVATIDLTLGAVSYHHERRGNDSKKTGILPVPNDVVDVAFLEDEIWFASLSGAARLRGEDLTVFTEAEGLDNEILHAIVATDGGLVYAGSRTGVEVYDGSRWSQPRPLALVVHSLGIGNDGKLWMGTEHGVVAYDGQRVLRVDQRAGLLEDRIDDIFVDFLGRIWARSPQGFSLVVPP